jgi:hypothetical protein
MDLLAHGRGAQSQVDTNIVGTARRRIHFAACDNLRREGRVLTLYLDR